MAYILWWYYGGAGAAPTVPSVIFLLPGGGVSDTPATSHNGRYWHGLLHPNGCHTGQKITRIQQRRE